MPAITPRKQSKLLLSAALIASSSAFFSSTRAEDDHDHDDHDHDDRGEPCQCIAGLSIDCATAMTTTQTALDYLETNSGVCKTTAYSAECKSNYYVMQAHHDHCAHNQVPHDVKDKVHDYENFYKDCYVRRQYDSKLSSCPAVDCSNILTTYADIYTEMADNDCDTNNCSSNECKTRYQTMLWLHDRCAEHQLPTNLEKGTHEYEEKCKSHLCNTAEAAFTLDTSVCSPAPSVIASSSKFVLGLAGFAAYFLM